jgi:hypothetical protein
MAGNLSQQTRADFAAVASILIPGSADQPSPREIEIQGAHLDRALAARPDLAQELIRAVELGRAAKNLDELIARFRSEPDAFIALTTLVAGAYYLDARTLTHIEYTPPSPRWEIGELEAEVIDLLPTHAPGNSS